MKNFTIVGLFLLTFVFSCEKPEKGLQPDYSNVRIKSISGTGVTNSELTFKYTNNRLTSIGKEQFIYDTEGKIIASRTFSSDTSYFMYEGNVDTSIYVKLEKYSYRWEGGKVIEKTLDTLMSSAYRNKNNYSQSLSTNYPPTKYFYANNRIDSIYYGFRKEGDRVTSSRFEYDEAGNIKKITEHTSPINTSPTEIPTLIFSDIIYEYEYDSHPNPFHILWQQTGIVIDKVGSYNISKNNPIKITARVITSGQEQSLFGILNDYEYDSRGLPIKKTLRGPNSITKIIYEQ